jgi:putative glycosyltransferase (TIGR04348 family)
MVDSSGEWEHRAMHKPSVLIVSPAKPGANNGNSHTAARWQRFLAPLARVQVALRWEHQPIDALIALHARRSAESVIDFAARCPGQGLALVLTGTDLYRDLDTDALARHALQCASRLVVLQPQGLMRLAPEVARRARVIEQSATRMAHRAVHDGRTRFVAVGHLREVKDPLTLMQAARLLAGEADLLIEHIGAALEPELGEAARATAAECSLYDWAGALPARVARRRIAASDALVHMSRMEGGANVVIEALRSGTPVLASRIDGNLGLLGADYDGYFPCGDAGALAALMRRFARESAFAEHLRAQCQAREARFAPALERAAVRRLLAELTAARDADAGIASLTESSASPPTDPTP